MKNLVLVGENKDLVRFKARGCMVIDSEGEFDFPQFETYHDAKKVADMLNILSGGENGRKS